MAGMDFMRSFVSRQYGGDWADRVMKMPDYQVAAIFHRMISELDNIKKTKQEPRLRETEVRGGVQLCLFEGSRGTKIKEGYLT